MAKRGNGEGSVYRRKSDGKWVGAVTMPNGKKKYHYGKTRKECARWLEDTLKSKRGLSSDSEISLIYWLKLWFKDYCINIRPSTRMNYDTYINRHIASAKIAELPLHQINTFVLQDFFNNLYHNGRIDGNGGLSPKTVRNLYNMLHKALKQAVGNQLIFQNPSEFVVLPKLCKNSVKVLDIQEQEQLLNACIGERWEIAVQLSLSTGLRIGELLALRQSDIMTADGITYLNVNKSLQRVKDYSGQADSNSTVLTESNTKTENSVRQIPLPPFISYILSEHLEKQLSESRKSYGVYLDNPYIICNEIGNHVDPSTYRKWFKKVTEKACLTGNVTPHTLRHSFASSALKYGMNLKNISDILGHYSTDFTARTYVHTDLTGNYNAMLSMEQAMKERRNNDEHKLLS